MLIVMSEKNLAYYGILTANLHGINVSHRLSACVVAKEIIAQLYGCTTEKRVQRKAEELCNLHKKQRVYMYKGILLNYIQNNGKIIPPVKELISAECHCIEIPDAIARESATQEINLLTKKETRRKLFGEYTLLPNKDYFLGAAAWYIHLNKAQRSMVLDNFNECFLQSKINMGFLEYICTCIKQYIYSEDKFLNVKEFPILVPKDGLSTILNPRQHKPKKIKAVKTKLSHGYSRQKAQQLYLSEEWRALRYEVLREQGGVCQLCGRGRKDGVILHVDHIIPLSKDWSRRLDKNNLQVLCEDCNLGKSNTDEIDWR